MQANDDRLRQLGAARFIDERELAAMTGLKTRTLQRWRVFGKGPRFHKLGGAVRYQLVDVEAWLATCTVGGGGATR
jgi:predicted DNA-binding transcriptional regulator AlpA